MRYFLGIDFGGGASKATLLSEEGKVVASSTSEYSTTYTVGGGAEQNPDDWVLATVKNIKELLSTSKVDAYDIAALCLDAATHTAVIMDENFKVIRPAIYWTDTRSVAEVDYLKRDYGDLILSETLHEPGTIWTLPELLWIRNNEPQNWGRVKRILFAKDYVRHALTGDYVTDYIEAEGSMLFNVKERVWSKNLCDILGLEVDLLPNIVSPTDIVGGISKDGAIISRLVEGTPVIAGTTDTAMEVLSAGAVFKGQMTLKLATAGRICVITDKPYPHRDIVNYSHVGEGLYYPGTATKAAASAYRWFRDSFSGDYAELDAAASNIDIGCEGLVFHPYLNGELTPYANPKLCADFVGIRSHHTKAHFARAVLEGVAMSMLECKILIDELGIEHTSRAAIIGGGGKSPLWRQMIADALGIELVEMRYTDSSFGSALLCAVALGAFDSLKDAVECCNSIVSITTPNIENKEKYGHLFKKYKAVQKALEPIYNNF